MCFRLGFYEAWGFIFIDKKIVWCLDLLEALWWFLVVCEHYQTLETMRLSLDLPSYLSFSYHS